MQEYQYLFNSKHYENLPHCRKFVKAHFAIKFNIYDILTFLGIFATSINFLFSNSNMYTSKISMVKAILDIFIETKDAKHYTK